MLRPALTAIFAASLCVPALAAPPVPVDSKLAFFGLTFLDTSTEGDIMGENRDETRRVEMLETMVLERFREEGYRFLSTGPVQDQLDRIVNPAKCYGCDQRMGAELGADYVLVGEVQKVSNLILAMNLQLRAVGDGMLAAGRSVEIRSNTDDSWRRGMRYLLKNAIFAEPRG